MRREFSFQSSWSQNPTVFRSLEKAKLPKACRYEFAMAPRPARFQVEGSFHTGKYDARLEGTVLNEVTVPRALCG